MYKCWAKLSSNHIKIIMPGGNKTKTLTIAEKITLIDKFKNENLSQRQFSAKHSVTLTVLNTMLKMNMTFKLSWIPQQCHQAGRERELLLY